jgi:hypothetical protein
MKKSNLIILTLYTLFICFIASCSKDSDNDTENITNSKEGLIRDVNDAKIVSTALGSLVDNVTDNLSTGSFTNKEVAGPFGGTASVTGTKSSSKISQYTTEYKRVVTIVFNNYQYQSYKISGSVYYKLNDYTSSYSNYKLIRQIDGSNLSIEITSTNYTIKDICTVSLTDYEDSRTRLAGNVTGKSGISYAVK